MNACKSKGFTLIELVMVIILLGITAIPLSFFVVQHTRGTMDSNERTQALSLGKYEMDKALAINPDTISDDEYTSFGFTITRTVEIVQSDGDFVLRSITVKVARTSDPSTPILTLVTYVFGPPMECVVEYS